MSEVTRIPCSDSQTLLARALEQLIRAHVPRKDGDYYLLPPRARDERVVYGPSGTKATTELYIDGIYAHAHDDEGQAAIDEAWNQGAPKVLSWGGYALRRLEDRPNIDYRDLRRLATITIVPQQAELLVVVSPAREGFTAFRDRLVTEIRWLCGQEPDRPPWERIPDVSDNRLLVQLVHQGLPVKAIASQLGRPRKTVANRISALRKLYGQEILPYRHRGRDIPGVESG